MDSLTFTTIPNSPFSLGLVCEFVSRFPPFNNFEFERMVKTLLYQLQAGTHVVVGLDDRIVGYVGWIRTTQQIAEAWVEQDAQLRMAEDADAIAVSVLVAEDSKHVLPLIRHAKTLNIGCSVYWKRYFPDGRSPARRKVRRKA
jgi:hypothetical protein